MHGCFGGVVSRAEGGERFKERTEINKRIVSKNLDRSRMKLAFSLTCHCTREPIEC